MGPASNVPGPQGPPGPTGDNRRRPAQPGPRAHRARRAPPAPQGAASTVPGPAGPKGDSGDTGRRGCPGIEGAPGHHRRAGPDRARLDRPRAAGPPGPTGAASTVPGPTGPQGIPGRRARRARVPTRADTARRARQARPAHRRRRAQGPDRVNVRSTARSATGRPTTRPRSILARSRPRRAGGIVYFPRRAPTRVTAARSRHQRHVPGLRRRGPTGLRNTAFARRRHVRIHGYAWSAAYAAQQATAARSTSWARRPRPGRGSRSTTASSSRRGMYGVFDGARQRRVGDGQHRPEHQLRRDHADPRRRLPACRNNYVEQRRCDVPTLRHPGHPIPARTTSPRRPGRPMAHCRGQRRGSTQDCASGCTAHGHVTGNVDHRAVGPRSTALRPGAPRPTAPTSSATPSIGRTAGTAGPGVTLTAAGSAIVDDLQTTTVITGNRIAAPGPANGVSVIAVTTAAPGRDRGSSPFGITRTNGGAVHGPPSRRRRTPRHRRSRPCDRRTTPG